MVLVSLGTITHYILVHTHSNIFKDSIDLFVTIALCHEIPFDIYQNWTANLDQLTEEANKIPELQDLDSDWSILG